MATKTEINEMRNAMRSATVGAKKQFKRVRVEHDGIEYEFVQPSLRDRKEIFDRCMDGEGNMNSVLLQIEAIINLTVIPDTDVRVFERGDKESLLEFPAGSFVDVFSEKAVNIMTGRDSSETAEGEDTKND